MAAKHRDFFESLSDEDLRGIVDDAMLMVINEMGVTR